MFELTVAERHILGNPKMVLFTVLSVALAVGVIFVMIGLMEGYKENLIEDTVENAAHVTVDPKEDEDYIYLYRTISAIALESPEVVAASPRLIGRAAAKYKDNVEGVTFIGADPVQEDLLLRVQDDLVWGDYGDLRFKRFAAVVGDKLSDDLELKWGDDFQLIRQNESIRVKVVGIIDTGTGLDQTLVYLPLKTAQDLLGEGDVVSEVGMRLSDIYAAPAVAAELNNRTRYQAESWQDKSRDVLDMLATQQFYSYLFYFLIFLISGLGIANTMIMIISRRTKEIGIMMAMGADQVSIMKIFVLESAILGPPSALLGGGLAYVAAKVIGTFEVPAEVYIADRMTVILEPVTFVYVAVFALLVNLIAGIYPAYKASRLDPVEAIATE